MNGIKKIRSELGINQQDLADYLGVVRSAIALAETNRQQLPINALLKLDALLFQIPNNISAEQVPLTTDLQQEQQNELNLFLQEQNTIHTHKIKQLQNNLLALQHKYMQAFKLLQGLRNTKQNLADIPANKKDILWLAVMEAEAIEKIKVNGLVAQQKLQIKINALTHQTI